MKTSQWLGRVAVVAWAGGALALFCCTSLSGLDDKVFDLGKGGTDAGVGGGPGGIGGQAIGGQGGHIPTEAVAVWAVKFGSAGDDYASAVAVGPSGDFAIVGHVEDAVTIDGHCSLFPVDAGPSIFIAKFAETGQCEWSHTLGELVAVSELDVAIDPSGNVLLVGGFQGSITLGEGGDSREYSDTNKDGFYVEFDADGTQLDHDVFPGDGTQRLTGVASSEEGKMVVVGHHEREMVFDGGCGQVDACVDTSGACEDSIVVAELQVGAGPSCTAVKGFQHYYEQHALAVAVSNDGSVVFTGFAMGEVDFGGGTLPGENDDRDIYITKLKRNSLEYEWSGRWGHEHHQRGQSVDVETRTGEVVVTGSLVGTATFDGGPIGTHDEDSDAFVVRLSSDGNQILYARALGESGKTQRGTAVLARPQRLTLLGGIFDGTLDCGGEQFHKDGGTDMFLVQLAPDGDDMWCESYSSSGSVELADMAALGETSVVIFGSFDGTMNIGATELTAHGDTEDLFLARLDLR